MQSLLFIPTNDISFPSIILYCDFMFNFVNISVTFQNHFIAVQIQSVTIQFLVKTLIDSFPFECNTNNFKLIYPCLMTNFDHTHTHFVNHVYITITPPSNPSTHTTFQSVKTLDPCLASYLSDLPELL